MVSSLTPMEVSNDARDHHITGFPIVSLNSCLSISHLEFYDDLHNFHEAVPNILNEGGIYTWFNGLGATNQFFHDVYCRISEIDLREMGLSTEYIEMKISTADEDGVWDNVRQRYWVLDTYKLPICRFLTQ